MRVNWEARNLKTKESANWVCAIPLYECQTWLQILSTGKKIKGNAMGAIEKIISHRRSATDVSRNMSHSMSHATTNNYTVRNVPIYTRNQNWRPVEQDKQTLANVKSTLLHVWWTVAFLMALAKTPGPQKYVWRHGENTKTIITRS